MPFQGIISWHFLPRAMPSATMFCPFRALSLLALPNEGNAIGRQCQVMMPERAKYSSRWQRQRHQNKEIFMLFCTTFPREPCYEQHFLATSHKVVVKFPNSMQLPSEFDSKRRIHLHFIEVTLSLSTEQHKHFILTDIGRCPQLLILCPFMALSLGIA